MSVAYQSWELASGPTVGYNLGAQGNNCGAEGSNYRLHPQQDSVIRGLSALSLYVQSHSEADGSAEEVGCHASLSKEGVSLVFEPPPLVCVTSIDQQIVAAEDDKSCGLSDSIRLMNGHTSMVNTQLCNGSHRLGHVFWDPCHSSALDVVSEDRPWENCPVVENVFESDTISSSSSMSEIPEESPCSSEDVSQVAIEDTEAQSSFKEASDSMSCFEATLLPKKGLSRFFSGKSRSFSCLADVVSVRDLAKPENPYARKRKNLTSHSSSFDRPLLHPHRSGATGISKKPPPHNSKCTLALAVAMTTKVSLDAEEQDIQLSPGVSGRWPSNSAPSRSYSLSDLQKAGNLLLPP